LETRSKDDGYAQPCSGRQATSFFLCCLRKNNPPQLGNRFGAATGFAVQLVLLGMLASCAGYTSTKVTQSSSDLVLALSATSLSFGNVTVNNASVAHGVTVSNDSTGTITVNAVALSGPFTSAGNALPTTLTPGESATFNVIFKPSASGSANGTLTIRSTAANSPSVVTLTGTGVSTPTLGDLTISPNSLSFGTEPVSSSSPAQSIMISNGTSGPITVSSVGVSGPFAVTGGSSPATLNPGQSLTLNATFAPNAAGAANGSVTINSTAGNSPATVTLAGTGAACNAMINPVDNLPQIVSANPEGTTFCFNAGTYRMTTYVLPKNNDVFLGLSLGADLNGSQLVTSWTQSGNYWVAANQPQLIAQTTDVCADSTSNACQFADAVFVDNAPLNRVMSLADVVSGTFYRDYGNKLIYIADDPTGHTLEAVVCSRPFLANGTGVDGVTIQGLTIEKFAGDTTGAVEGRATWTIQGNEVRLNHGDGINASGNILGNYSHDNGDFGIEGGYASTAMNVQGNELAFNNWANFFNGGGAKFEYATNLVVSNNYAHDNYGPGFHTDGDCANVLYEYNHTKNNLNAGIQHEISWDAIIRYNLFEDETSAIPQSDIDSLWAHFAIGILNSSNVQIYGNTITNSTNGIGAVLFVRGNSTHGPHTGQPYLMQNLDVHDNTFSGISVSAAGIVKAPTYSNAVYTSWNNHFTKDTYSLADLNGSYFIWMDSSGNNAYATYTWGQWQNFGNDTSGLFQVASSDTSVVTTSSHTP
jgi:Right handed beta helix region/Abnormal spindle-like microcephaly-assoc'd, ASPM-SPD-2-Hydin